MNCNAFECPFINNIGYCMLTACIRRDLADKHNASCASNKITIATPDIYAKNYTKIVINHICSICGESQHKDSYYATTDFWICPECVKKIGKLIGVRTDD